MAPSLERGLLCMGRFLPVASRLDSLPELSARRPTSPKSCPRKDKLDIFRDIVNEMIKFFVGSGLSCEQNGDHYRITKYQVGGGAGPGNSWNLMVVEGDVREAVRSDTRLGSSPAKPRARFLTKSAKACDPRSTMWIDIAKKEQSRYSNDLGDEVSSFLKRYGVRTLRVPPLPSSSS